MVFRQGHGGGGRERRLQEIDSEKEAESQDLHSRGETKEEATWKQQGGESLHGKNGTEKEGAGGGHGEPVGREGLKESPNRIVLGSDEERPRQASGEIQGQNGKAEQSGRGGHFCQEDGARGDR